jgi:NDP-sugar pyrophosphorylase family protein
MRAMILAAGFGTRLWPLTIDRTKPALPVLGTPLIGRVAQYLAGFGITDIAVNLHHEPDSVRKALGDGSAFGVNLHYVEEKEILGTSGALDNAKDFLSGSPFVVINGKIITDLDLKAAIDTHQRMEALATLVLMENEKRERFSRVYIEEEKILGFGGMPDASDNASDVPLMFTGIQILEPEIFDYIPKAQFSNSTTDVYPHAIADGKIVAAYVGKGTWRELSTIPRYLEVCLELLDIQGKDVFAGPGCEIAQNSVVQRSILWDGVRVSEGAVVKNCILADRVIVGPGEVLENKAVVPARLVKDQIAPAKAMNGHIIGDNFVVELPG